MPKDIRSYFQLKGGKTAKAEDENDTIPESPEVSKVIPKKRESRKKRVLSDSDEEIFSSKKKKLTNDPENSNKKKQNQSKANLKEVKPADLFGNGPIKRTEPLVKKEKLKKKTETGIHSDDDFDKSLLELDAIENSLITEETPSTSKKNQDLHVNSKSPDKKDRAENHKKSNSNGLVIKIENEKSPKKLNGVNWKGKNEIKTEAQSKLDTKVGNEKKTKYAEFLKNETNNENSEDNGSKKKKFNDSITDKSTTHTKKELKSSKKEVDHDGNDSDATIIDDQDIIEDSQMNHTLDDKKKKRNKSLNESVLTDEERHERKRMSAALYKNYLNRSGPKHLGAKEIPEGTSDCLKDCAFLFTGVLDSFEREEVTNAIVKYGGCIKNSMSRKVTHVLAGDDPGPAKMAKAQELGIKIISEDDFIQMIKESTTKKDKEKIAKTPHKKSSKDKKEPKANGVNLEKVTSNKKTNEDVVKNKREKTKGVEIKENKSRSPNNKSETDKKSEKKADSKGSKNIESEPKVKTESSSTNINENDNNIRITGPLKSGLPSHMMWVDKYKPQNLKQIIGQHTDASNVKKLSNWLTKWYVNRKAKLPKPSPWAKNDDGGYYKAALLSGPPGVGKTTTVALVCKELGFDVVEFNASDTRSKNLIKEQISELLTTTSLSGYAKGDTGKQAVTKKHVLVMDEVDGMAGNEDRGGLQELIGLIKSTSVPIVCMCNDRNSQKMRSLVNYCYDLRFTRPKVEQIKSAMMSICFKEGLKIPQDALIKLIVAANQDVRQTLNLLSMWAAEPDPDKLRKDATSIRKDLKLGPWDAVRKVFSAEDHKSMSINDKSDLFFYDYSLAPLFVHENYLQVSPHCPKQEVLKRLSEAADSISAGDLVDARIRRNQAWGLLPIQAMYSSVIPGHWLSGHVAGQIQFPGWLGKNSRAGKMQRLCQEIHAHTRLSTSGSKSSIFLDYSAHLRDAIVTPLVKDRSDGIAKAMEVLESYHLLREDLDSLTELSIWPGQRNPMVLIDSKVKAAMTRTYNKSATALPYAPGVVKKGKAKEEDPDGHEEEEVDDEADDSDPENDALIKKKKTNDKPSKEKASSSKEKAGSSKVKKSSTKEKKK